MLPPLPKKDIPEKEKKRKEKVNRPIPIIPQDAVLAST